MGRLVNTDDLYELIEKDFDGVCVYDVDPSEAVNDFQHIVDLAPTVDAEPVRHGKWVEHHEPYTWMGYAYWTCSECNYGEENENGIRSNYCPVCGAKMDEE